MVGALWEVFEVVAGQYVPQSMVGDINDTAMDLIMDTLGAVLATFIAPIVFKRTKR